MNFDLQIYSHSYTINAQIHFRYADLMLLVVELLIHREVSVEITSIKPMGELGVHVFGIILEFIR